jgi:putative peptidoglycan lipid II flippase
MKRNAGLISVVYGITTAIQILGQIVVARIFGARVELDAFVSAVTIPTLLTNMIAGTFNNAFLPELKKYQLKNEGESISYFFRTMLLLSGGMIVISIVLDAVSPLLVNGLVGARGPAFIEHTDTLMRWMLYTMPFSLIGVFCNSYFYSKNKFILPSIAYLIGSIVNLAFIIVLSGAFGIWSMVIGFITAIVLQVVISFPYALVSRVRWSHVFVGSIRHDMTILFRSWLPLVLSMLALRYDGIILRTFSAHLPTGYITYTNLVFKLFSGLVGITMIGIQTVTFPHLVETIQKKDIHYAIRQVNKAKIYTFILSLIVIGIIVFISPFFMRLLLTGGKFNKENVETLISLFPYFILPAIGWGVDSLFSQPITAIGKQHLMTGVNIIAVVLAWGGATVANTYFGGLTAISTGLIVLIFTGIIGAEIIWRIERVKLLKSHT